MTHPFGRLADIPRVPLGHSPTPIDGAANLSRQAGGAQLWIKRDDCTGLAFGGNKVRQLEYYFGAAQAGGADTVLITGAVQSNYVRVAAAAARQLGMDIHVQLENRVPRSDSSYEISGNVLLDRLLGATLHSFPEGENEAGADQNLQEIAHGLKADGRTPYIIPLGPGHQPLGALGYVDAAREIVAQVDQMDLALDEVVLASGSGNTHAGLLFGLRALDCDVRVTGVCVRRSADAQRPRVLERCGEIADLLEVPHSVSASDIQLTDDHLAPGYGQLNDRTVAAIKQTAQSEGLFLDPVYTGKAMAGCLDRLALLEANKNCLFIHTGGTPALFGYTDDFT